MSRRFIVLVAWAAVVASSNSARAEGPTGSQGSALRLSASAGLAGVGRPGRWMPVEVVVDNQGDDIAGHLIIEWGSATVDRRVSIPAPSRRTYAFFIRTGDVRDEVTVHLRSGGRELKSVDAPVRLIGDDHTFALCVTGASMEAADGRDCSAVISPAALPRSWRGYDAADRVSFSDTTAPGPDQREAFQLWSAIRRVEELGTPTSTGGALATDASPWDRARLLLILYAFSLSAIALAFRPSRRRSRLAVAAVALVAFGGSAAAFASGRMTAVTIRHVTVVQQFAGARDALVTMRGAASFASDGTYAITPVNTDGSMDVGQAYGVQRPQLFENDGQPLLAGTFGLGSTEPFQLELAAPVTLLRVTRRGDETQVTNVSSRVLHGCALPSAFRTRDVETLEPGQSIETTGTVTDADPIVSCSFDGSPIDFTDPVHHVITKGTTTAVYHLTGGAASNDSR